MSEPVDVVNHPPHYTRGGVECVDAIESALTPEEFRGYCKGNAMKYLWREKHKGQNESVAKAEWYIKRMLQEKVAQEMGKITWGDPDSDLAVQHPTKIEVTDGTRGRYYAERQVAP